MCETIPSGAYVVRLPLDRTRKLQEFLEGLGAEFNPRSSAIAFSESDHSERPVVMGYEARDLAGRINGFLQTQGLTPRLPGEPESWSMAQLHELLELAAPPLTRNGLATGLSTPVLASAAQHFNWDQGRGPTGAWWRDDGIGWAEIAGSYPALFGPE